MIQLRSEVGGWGCGGATWGDLDIVVVEQPSIFSIFSRPSTDPGCPSSKGPGAPLISQTVTSTKEGVVVVVVGHIIRFATGRADLHLTIDGTLVDRSLTFTSSKQWEDAQVFYIGEVEPGTVRSSPPLTSLSSPTHRRVNTGVVRSVVDSLLPLWRRVPVKAPTWCNSLAPSGGSGAVVKTGVVSRSFLSASECLSTLRDTMRRVGIPPLSRAVHCQFSVGRCGPSVGLSDPQPSKPSSPSCDLAFSLPPFPRGRWEKLFGVSASRAGNESPQRVATPPQLSVMSKYSTEGQSSEGVGCSTTTGVLCHSRAKQIGSHLASREQRAVSAIVTERIGPTLQ